MQFLYKNNWPFQNTNKYKYSNKHSVLLIIMVKNQIECSKLDIFSSDGYKLALITIILTS